MAESVTVLLVAQAIAVFFVPAARAQARLILRIEFGTACSADLSKTLQSDPFSPPPVSGSSRLQGRRRSRSRRPRRGRFRSRTRKTRRRRPRPPRQAAQHQIGGASCRERGGQEG